MGRVSVSGYHRFRPDYPEEVPMVNWIFEKLTILFWVPFFGLAFGTMFLPWVTWGDRVFLIVISTSCLLCANHIRSVFEQRRLRHVRIRPRYGWTVGVPNTPPKLDWRKDKAIAHMTRLGLKEYRRHVGKMLEGSIVVYIMEGRTGRKAEPHFQEWSNVEVRIVEGKPRINVESSEVVRVDWPAEFLHPEENTRDFRFGEEFRKVVGVWVKGSEFHSSGAMTKNGVKILTKDMIAERIANKLIP